MRSLCIKLVALRMNLYREVALSFKKVGDPAMDSLVLLSTKYKCTWLTAISMSLPRCIICQDVCVQQSHVTKRLLPSGLDLADARP